MLESLSPLLAPFITPATLAYLLFIFTLCETIKRIVYKGWPAGKTNFLFTEVFLHVFPMVLGGVGAGLLFGKYPFPEVITTREFCVIIGTLIGAVAAFGYNRLRKLLSKLTEGKDTSAALPPSGP